MQNIYTRLINRNHPLPPDYVPENLVDIGIPFDTRPGDPKRLLEKKTAHAALCLINAACKEGLCLYGISGYRSYKRQQELYTGNPYVAQPGTSEHQSGLALDVSCPAVGLELIPEFAQKANGLPATHLFSDLFSAIPRTKKTLPEFHTSPGISATSHGSFPDI